MGKGIIATAFLPLVFLVCWVLFVLATDDSVGDKASYAISKLYPLELAVRKLAANENFTAADWDKLGDMTAAGPRIAGYLEQGMDSLLDPWGEQYVLEKRDAGDQIVITIRSNHMLRRRWWREDKVIGIELVVARADGKVVERRDLWR